MTISLLLADDQPMLRLGYRLVLDAQPDMYVTGEAGDGAAAVRLAESLRPDIVLMDVRMPGLDGIQATERIVAAGSATRVLILTTFDLDEYAYQGLRAGASGFLLKDVPPPDLLSAIRAVASGDAVVAPSVTRRLLDAFLPHLPHLPDPGTGLAIPPELGSLTAREREILEQVAAGLSNAEIAARLVLAEATVKTHGGADPAQAAPARPRSGRGLRLRAPPCPSRQFAARSRRLAQAWLVYMSRPPRRRRAGQHERGARL